MHGKGRFAHGKESATLYLSSTCSTLRGSHGWPPDDSENIYILIDSFTLGGGPVQQRTTLGLSIPLVALRVSTTNWDSPTTRR